MTGALIAAGIYLIVRVGTITGTTARGGRCAQAASVMPGLASVTTSTDVTAEPGLRAAASASDGLRRRHPAVRLPCAGGAVRCPVSFMGL